MKYLVLILVNILLNQHFVLSQFQLPTFKPTPATSNIPASPGFGNSQDDTSSQGLQIPAPYPYQATTSPSPLLPLNGFSPAADNQQKSFKEIFNPALPNIFPSNLLSTLIQEFIKIFKGTSSLNFSSGFRQLSTNIGYESVPEPIRESLEKAFKQYKKSVNASFVQGLEKIRNSFGRFNETVKSSIELSDNLVTTGLQDINRTISKYNESVQSCVYAQASYYEAIIPNAGDKAKDCIHQKVSEVKNVIENGESNIVEAVDGAQNLTTTIRQCSSDEAQENFHFGVIGCYVSALFNVHKETILLPLQLTQRFGEIDKSITSAYGDIIACTSAVSKTIAEQSLNVTETIADCLIRK